MGSTLTTKSRETSVLKEVCQEIHRTGSVTEQQKVVLDSTFQKGSQQALALVEEGKVSRFKFQPSGRTVWVVKGRKGEYQVLPESMFCTCDDYYFRVMGEKRQLCYHLVAQHVAEALGKFHSSELTDSDYDAVTAKWRPSPPMG